MLRILIGLIMPFAPVAIDQNNYYFGIGFVIVIWKPLYSGSVPSQAFNLLKLSDSCASLLAICT